MKTSLCLVALAAGTALVAPAFAQTADLIFQNGTIITMDPDAPSAEAVAIAGNEIIYVGDRAGADAIVGDGTETIDLNGRTLMPGFVSGHDHLIASTWVNAGVQLYEANSLEEALKLIADYAAANPDIPVIKGIGWNVEKFGGDYPTAADLDRAVPDRPAILLDFTIHDAWLNTAAMEAGNVTKDDPDVLPGVTFWRRDEAGNPTGVGIELQWMKTYVDIGAWDAEPMINANMDAMFPLAAQNGTTAFLNPGIVTPNVKATNEAHKLDFMMAMQILEEREAAGGLPLRVVALPMFKSAVADPATFVEWSAEMRDRYQGDKIRVQSVKIHPEGNWTAGVAPFLEPYKSDPLSKGAFNVQPEVTAEIVKLANAAGLDVAIHTDGDASTRAAVDAILASREAGYGDARNVLHHLLWTHPDDMDRIVEFEIPVNATPSFTTDWTGQDEQSYRMLGEERTELEMGKYTDVLLAGNRVSISADVPSTSPDMQAPLHQVEAAVTLMEPTEQGSSKPFPKSRTPVSVEEALKAVTIDAAWQLRMEDKVGSLEVGKLADLVVLSDSPFKVEPLEIDAIRVEMTMMDGEFTFIRDRDSIVEVRAGEYLMPDDLPQD
ncbi:amidohydrolase [Oceanomicrobium pacificus]|uniref:Amidohydrolase family protein n=1 Tax=Oceanomicrobium pacificus TaxID=2692916 RepID=A0A6B0TKY4_9RHOB|nr:amidohydrolase [Oceanomicrobium pacificus]MXU65180.1 amidohydrolase family protein [Oceanomicrobium pacificus]